MLEHDAKEILSRHGVPVPPGVLVASAAGPALPFDGPAVVKARRVMSDLDPIDGILGTLLD